MKELKEESLVYEKPASSHRNFMVNVALVLIILCLPVSFVIRIFPEILDFLFSFFGKIWFLG